jgi:hypothetical protein
MDMRSELKEELVLDVDKLYIPDDRKEKIAEKFNEAFNVNFIQTGKSLHGYISDLIETLARVKPLEDVVELIIAKHVLSTYIITPLANNEDTIAIKLTHNTSKPINDFLALANKANEALKDILLNDYRIDMFGTLVKTLGSTGY